MVTTEENYTHRILIHKMKNNEPQKGSKTLKIYNCKLCPGEIKDRLKKAIDKDNILDNGD